jgi:hypothetical protein
MKGDVKNKLLPQRRQEIFLEIQPPTWHLRKELLPGHDRNGSRSQLGDVESFRFHLRVINCVAERFQRGQAVWVVLATRVLSETRGLWLYGVIRGGI